MRLWQWATILVCTASASAAMGQQLTNDQVQQIFFLCQTVKETRGEKTERQLQAEVEAKAAGLFRSVFNVGGGSKGTISQEKFDGLTQQATAELLKGDRDCRKEMATRLYDAIRNNPQATTTKSAPQAQSAPKVQSAPEVELVDPVPRNPYLPKLKAPFHPKD